MEEGKQENIVEEQAVAPEVAPHADNAAAVNMANLRESKLKLEREKADLAAQLKEYEQAAQQPKEEEPQYGAEDFVEGKHLKKEIDDVKKQIEAYKAQQIADTDAAQLTRTYSDFESVVSPANIAKMKELDPETADTIAMSQASLYKRGSAAYKRIKELGIVREDTHVNEREHAQDNAAKPRPSNSVSPQTGDSALSMANAFANGLTDDLKKQLWKEMQDVSKRH